MKRELSKELKPCPYCGGKGELKEKHHWNQFKDYSMNNVSTSFIRCKQCHARTLGLKPDTNLYELVYAWNAGHVFKNVSQSKKGANTHE